MRSHDCALIAHLAAAKDTDEPPVELGQPDIADSGPFALENGALAQTPQIHNYR